MNKLEEITKMRKRSHSKLLRMGSKVYRKFNEMENEAFTPGALTKKEKDFITYVGETIKIKTFKPIDQRKNYQGKLLGYKEGKVVISSENQELLIPFSLISKANIQYQFPDPKKKKASSKNS